MYSVEARPAVQHPAAVTAALSRSHRLRQWVAGLVVGLVIMVTASLSLGVVCVAIDGVLLDDLRNYLRRTAETAAAQIDGERHLRFTDSSQTATPEYLALSVPLAALLQANPDIHFAYSGVIRGDSMFFVLDGDRTADRAYVMQADEPTAGELEVGRLHHTVVERKPTPTAWGVGIRAYAPLGGRAGLAGAYVGITMSAGRYYAWVKRIYHTAALGFLVALVLAILAGVRMARVEGTRLRAETEIATGLKMAADAAEERRVMEARSQGRQKMEALGTLAGGVAHDFNNMLTVILGNAEMVAADASPGSALEASAEAIRTAAVRARDVVRRILLFSRPEAEARTPIALGPVIDDTLHLLAATMPSSITLVWQKPAQPVTAIGDVSQLTQVLMNLGVNASQALPDDRGTIEFRLEQVELGAAETTRLGLLPGVYAWIVVRDDGIGMSEEVRSRIFEPFFTTKAVGKGTGLGLSVVDGVVRGHRGALEVESALGGGTTFSLYLPAAEPVAQVAVPPAGPPAGARLVTGKRILLVDDEPMVLKVQTRVLRRAGYDVDAHADVDAVLSALAADSGGYAALVTDRTMPRLSGLEVARRARELNPRLPVVLLTGKSEPGDASSPHITVVLGKPADAAALIDAVERAIASGEPTEDTAAASACAARVLPAALA